jgi:uncharacterized SAM-binding protein YcdF (DUF218 family)/glycosyltransferase involved in cell wall biosynthesis
MLNKRNIVCISSIDWDFVWQGHQEIMATFAKSGNRVLFIENTGVRVPGLRDLGRVRRRLFNWIKGIKGFREVSRNLYVYSPLVLPFPYSRAAQWLNRNFCFGTLRRWLKLMAFKDVVAWTFLPTGTALDIVAELDCACLVYYCIADFDALVRQPRKVRKTENALIKRSDIIFAQGKAFAQKCRALNDNVYIFPFGLNTDIFAPGPDLPGSEPVDLKNIKRPLIGYVGGIHRHIDFALLKFLAQARPSWSFVLIGPVQADISVLKDIPNIVFLGKKDFQSLPAYIREFSVCIIPYAQSEFTKTVYPTKLNEYHALGKPVVATDLPEIIAYNEENENLVFVAGTREEFLRKIDSALGENDNALVTRRIQSVQKYSWDARIEEMSDLIEEEIERKKAAGFLGWQAAFAQAYRAARRRVVKFALCVFLLWWLVFYTPLVWLLASPLKISQAPRKADAIIVFAGGVGESGRPQQGYEERVSYAAQLYKQLYASKIIFSSGAAGAFPETYVMTLLAVSLGVPQGAIIQEDKAASNYQNVLFSLDILRKYGYNKVILVTSPYNMRRSALIFRKLTADDMEIMYSAAPQSEFYAHGGRDKQGKRLWRQASPAQIRAIAHEYLAIVYYWIKGYI